MAVSVGVMVTGNPTAEELAAALLALMSSGASEAAPSEHAASRWAARQDQLRRPLTHGPGAWRHALRPA